MALHRLTKAEARRIAIRAQLLDARRPTDLLEVANHLTFVQMDPTAAIAERRSRLPAPGPAVDGADLRHLADRLDPPTRAALTNRGVPVLPDGAGPASVPERSTRGTGVIGTGASTILTSNREPQEWLALTADPMLAQSAVDRIVNSAYELVGKRGNAFHDR